MSQKKFFGPKEEEIQEIIVSIPEDMVSFPKLQENSEPPLSINENEKSFLKMGNDVMLFEKSKTSSKLQKSN